MGVVTINNIRHHIITDAVMSPVRPGLVVQWSWLRGNICYDTWHVTRVRVTAAGDIIRVMTSLDTLTAGPMVGQRILGRHWHAFIWPAFIMINFPFQDPIIDDQNARLHSFNDVRFIKNPSTFGLKTFATSCAAAAWRHQVGTYLQNVWMRT